MTDQRGQRMMSTPAASARSAELVTRECCLFSSNKNVPQWKTAGLHMETLWKTVQRAW